MKCYERTSQEQQQTATRAINCPSNANATEPVKESSSEFISSVASSTSESKPLIGASGEPSALSLGGFSGNYTNCTINDQHFFEMTIYVHELLQTTCHVTHACIYQDSFYDNIVYD